MKIYFCSDLHVDYYVQQSKFLSVVENEFEEFYKRYFIPADFCCISGDIANDVYTHVNLLKFLSTKYERVYCCFGNHDLVVVKGTYGNGNPFKTSEDKMSSVIEQFMTTNHKVRVLESNKLETITFNDTTKMIGGCMGMCDFKYHNNPIKDANAITNWKHWYDNIRWNYMGNKMFDIWNKYDNMMNLITSQSPDIMLTHFIPREMGTDPKYKNDISTAYFNFEGKPYLENMPNGGIWHCGHTHTAHKTQYINSIGNEITIICNPIGYPHEKPLEFNNLKYEDFLLEF